MVSQLFQQRIVRIGGPIEDEMANLCVAQLLYLDSANPKGDVTLYINVRICFITHSSPIFYPYFAIFTLFKPHTRSLMHRFHCFAESWWVCDSWYGYLRYNEACPP